MRMKYVLLLATVLVLIPAASNATLFSCDNEFCTFNGSTNKWSCHYEGCPNQPEWVQNVTQINQTTVNVTNCSIGELYEYWDSYVERIDRRFNFSEKLTEQEEASKSCSRELDFCNQKIVQQKSCIDENQYNNLDDQLTQKKEELENEQGSKLYVFLGGLIVGVGAMYFMNARSQPKKSDVEPTQGEHGFRPAVIDQDSKIAQQQARIDELEAKLQGKGKK